jgi:hypothetical protein
MIVGNWREMPRDALINLAYLNSTETTTKVDYKGWMESDAESVTQMMYWAIMQFTVAGIPPVHDLITYTKIESPNSEDDLHLFPAGDGPCILLTLAPSEAPSTYAFYSDVGEFKWHPEKEGDYCIIPKGWDAAIVRNLSHRDTSRVFVVITLVNP